MAENIPQFPGAAQPADDAVETAVEVLPPAGFFERAIAYFIDLWVAIIAAYGALYFLAVGGMVTFTPGLNTKWQWVTLGVFVIYSAIFSSGSGNTLGKSLMGIKAVDDNGGQLSFGKAFVRALGYLLSTLPLCAGFLLALANKDKKAVHDFIAGSRVVRLGESTQFAAGLTLAIGLAVCGFFGYSWYAGKFSTASAADKQLIAKAASKINVIAAAEQLHMSRFGAYTNDFARLAALSGNPKAFTKNVLAAVDAGGFEIGISSSGYYISARALDSKRTQVSLTGP